MTKIHAKNRVRNVTGSFYFCETHPHDQKTGRETPPLAIPQVELHSEFYEKRQFGRYSFMVFRAEWSILS